MPEVVATQTIHVATKDGVVTVYKGQRVDTKADYVKNAEPGMFVSADDAAKAGDPVIHRAAVEAATAVPGEARSVKKPAAKTSAKRKKPAK